MMKPILTAALLLIPCGALAQSQEILAERFAQGIPISPDAFADLTEGKTITYSDGTQDQYQEYYPPGSHSVILRYLGETDPDACITGKWRADGPHICFDWTGGQTVCSGWAQYDGVVISMLVENGEPSGGYEPISHFSSVPLTCDLGMVSYTVQP